MDWISSYCENHGMKRILHGTILLILGITIIEAQFINHPPSTERVCKDETVYFNWTYTTTTPALVVEWKVNGSRIALENVGAGQTFTPVTSYSGRLNKITNAQISLGLVTPNDTGTYKCEMTDVNGSPFQSNEITLTVYDVYNTPVQIEQTVVNKETILKPVSPDSSITYTWSGEGKSESGLMYTVTTSGNYTLCISGGRATCLDQSLSPCTSLVVTISGTVTTVYTTKTTTNSTTSFIDTTCCTETTSSSTSVSHTLDERYIALIVGVCGILIVIIIIIVIVKRRGKKTLRNGSVSKMQGETGHENVACNTL